MCVLWPGPADIWPGPADLQNVFSISDRELSISIQNRRNLDLGKMQSSAFLVHMSRYFSISTY